MLGLFSKLANLAPRVIALSDRFPWAMPLFGFVSGIASFLLIERKQELAQIIAIMILASWCWLSLEKSLHRWAVNWFGISVPRPLFAYGAQLVHQESLFFVIPFFFITTTWNSAQTLFTGLLMFAAVISILDPIYFRWLAPRRGWYFAFHGITLFAVLLTALPIIFHLPTAESYRWSLLISLLVTLSAAAGESLWPWWKRGLFAVVIIVSLGFIGFFIRPWVPPATLWLTEVAITNIVDGKSRAPGNHLTQLSQAELQQGLYAYTAIHAPRGLNERIYHVWKLNGQQVDKVALDINGGREAGYRAWSRKVNFPQDPVGRWQIRVMTEANQVIGVLRFTVTASAVPVNNMNESSTTSSSAEIVTPAAAMKAAIIKMVEEQ